MPSDNYFKVSKGARILGLFTFDSHDAMDVKRAFKLAADAVSNNAPRHKDEFQPRMSVWHKRTIIMTDGPWSKLLAVGQTPPAPRH